MRHRQSGLDCLSEPDLIREDHPLRQGRLEGEQGCVNLVRVEVDLRVEERRSDAACFSGGASSEEFEREEPRLVVREGRHTADHRVGPLSAKRHLAVASGLIPSGGRLTLYSSMRQVRFCRASRPDLGPSHPDRTDVTGAL